MLYTYITHLYMYIVYTSSRRPIPTILYRYPSGAARGGIFEGHVVVTLSSCRLVRTLRDREQKTKIRVDIQKNAR